MLTGVSFAGTHPGVRPRCAREVRSPGHEAPPQETGGPVPPDEIQPWHPGGRGGHVSKRATFKGRAFVEVIIRERNITLNTCCSS